MLRALGARTRVARDPGAALWLRRGAAWAMPAAAMLLLGRAQCAPRLSPFALAWFAAALSEGLSLPALLVGTAAGALGGDWRDYNLLLPLGAALVLLGRLAGLLLRLGWARVGTRREAGRAHAPTEAGEATAAALLAGLGILAPGLIDAQGAPWPSAQALGAALVAAAATPFFRSAMSVRPSRRSLTPEERIGLCLMGCGVAAGLWQLWPPLALGACAAAVSALSACGALAGAALGLSLLAMGAGETPFVLLGLGGAASQLCRDWPRWSRACALAAALSAAGALLGVQPAGLAALALGVPAGLWLPDPWRERLSRWLRAEAACEPHRAVDRERARSAERLRAMAAAFGELAEGYRAPCPLPDEQALLSHMRAALCDGCSGYEACWTGEDNRGARFLCGLIAGAMAGEANDGEGAETTPELMRCCRRGMLVAERLDGPLEDFVQARRSMLRRGAENRLVARQFSQAERLLGALAERQRIPVRLRSRRSVRAAAALERAGLGPCEVLAVGDALTVWREEDTWTEAQARAAARCVSAALGARYAPRGPLNRELCLMRLPRLRAEVGMACVSRQAGAPSGDSHLKALLEGDRLLLLLCDGMGSGAAAARESAAAARLLGRFMAAGAESALAIETVNALMLNRSQEDMFCTVDLLVIDLSTGEAEFDKLAACPTLIARGEEIRRVEGGRLPLGILDGVQPSVARARLVPGDMLLMASDGVMDALDDGALEALLTQPPGDMRSLSQRVLDAAQERCPPEHRDDMTALCVRLTARGG